MESRYHYYVLTCIVAQTWFLRSVFSSLRASSPGILDPSAYGFGNALAEELWVEICSPGRSGGGGGEAFLSPPPPPPPTAAKATRRACSQVRLIFAGHLC